jgi:FkbM family methyltransferase
MLSREQGDVSEMLARVKGEAGITRPRGRTLIVLGNGPSLSDFDFTRFRSFDTIGMNAAYRFWDRIGWYPRYYICLDAVVGQSHKPAIERLIRERKQNGIELFVLRKDLVEQFPPDIQHDQRIMLFENLRETSKLFTPMPFTTGSHAALVGVQLGYRRMHLMGVDADYVERIEGAEDRGGDVLQIGTTPEKNPNYFVKDYQLEGDKYTVPNPIPDLHVTCWKEVHDVLKANNVAVWNGSTKSRVDFIPFRSFDDVEAEEGVASAAPAAKDSSRGNAVSTAHLQYDRAAKASVDETAVVAALMAERRGSRHVLLDVGAHQGGSALHFDKLGWRIFCFEPDRQNREELTKRFGNSATVTIDPRAVSNAPAKDLPFFSSNESTGISGLHAFRDTHRQIATVDATSVAEIVSENGLSGIDFLKIDVEGHELAVLKGVPWDRIKPDAIECEFEDSKTAALAYTYRDMADLLVGLGYTVYVSEWHPILRYGQRHDWCRLMRYPAALLSPQAWGNILAFRVDPGIAALERSFRACLQFEGSRGMLAKVPTTEGQPPKVATRSAPVVGKPAAGPAGENLVSVSLSGYLTWCGNFLRRRPAVGVAFAVVLIALVAAATRQEAVPYRPTHWILFEAWVFGWLLLTGLGYTGTLARKVDRSLQRQREAMMDALARSQKQAATIEDGLTGVAGELKNTMARLEKMFGTIAQLSTEGKSAAAQAATTNANLSAKLADLSRLAEDAKAIAGRAETSGKLLLTSSSMYNFGRYRAFNRTLTDEHIETLKTVWSRRLSVPADNRTLGYAAHRICALESSMHGRLATTIEDIMLRSMVGQAVSEKSVSVLEIGTLFGIGAIAVMDALRREGKAAHLTVIDPLESYYGRAKDIVTGQVVSEQVFRDNLRIGGIPAEDVTIIKSMSASAEAMEAAAKRSYDLLIIDGDHSFAGVKGDFENYSPFVRPGGFVIFDDYGAQDWPDVKRFIDAEMPSHQRFVPVGAEWRTSIFRAVKAETSQAAPELK